MKETVFLFLKPMIQSSNSIERKKQIFMTVQMSCRVHKSRTKGQGVPVRSVQNRMHATFRSTNFFFFYMLCHFRSWAIIALHNILMILALSKFCICAAPPNLCYTNRLHKLVVQITFCFPLSLCLYGCHIFKYIFPHYVPYKYQLALPNSM